jgi:hypothetical protein
MSPFQNGCITGTQNMTRAYFFMSTTPSFFIEKIVEYLILKDMKIKLPTKFATKGVRLG